MKDSHLNYLAWKLLTFSTYPGQVKLPHEVVLPIMGFNGPFMPRVHIRLCCLDALILEEITKDQL